MEKMTQEKGSEKKVDPDDKIPQDKVGVHNAHHMILLWLVWGGV